MSEQNIEGDLGSSLEAPVDTRFNTEVAAPVTEKDHYSLLKFNRTALMIAGGVMAVMILIGVAAALTSKPNEEAVQKDTNLPVYNVSSLPFSGINEIPLALGQAERLTINGQLQVDGGFVLGASEAPEEATLGQFYFDQNTKEPYFYNGTAFVPLVQTVPQSVSSIGGANGVLGLGNGLRIVNGQLRLTDAVLQGATAPEATGGLVSSVQGQTGDVSFSAGNGIAFNGTTVTNTGLLSLGGAAGNVGLGRGLIVQGGALRSTVTLTAGSANLIIADDGNGNYTITDNGSGSTQIVLGPAVAQTDTTGNTTVNINKTSSGNFLQLASNGVNRFVVDQTGTITTGSIAYAQVTGAPATTVTSLGGASGAIALGSGLNLASGTLSNSGVLAVNGTTNQVNASTLSGVVTLTLPQAIATTSNPTFNNLTLNGTATVSTLGAGVVTSAVGGLLSSGAVDRNSATYFNTALNAANGGTGVNGAMAANGSLLIGNGTGYTLANLTQGSGISIANGAGAITVAVDSTICTTSGNCAGSGTGVTTTGGTVGTIALFTGTQAIGNSVLSQSGSVVNVAGGLTASAALQGNTLSIGGGTFAVNATGAITAATGITSSGIITLSSLNAAGVVKNSAAGVLSTGTVALGTETSGNYVALLGTLTGLTTTGNTGAGATPSLSVTYGSTANTAAQGNTAFSFTPASGNLTGSLSGTAGAGFTSTTLSVVSNPTFAGLVTANGGLTVANATTFTNAGATLNSAVNITNLVAGGFIGTAAATVDSATTFNVNQITAAQIISLPNPTTLTAGRIAYINNIGTAGFTMSGNSVLAGQSTAFQWNGSAWVPIGNPVAGTGLTQTGNVLSSAAATSVVNDTNITGSIAGNVLTLGYTGTLSVARGGTGSSTAAGARTNLGAAASGANADITSLSAATSVGSTGAALTLQGNAGSVFAATAGTFTTTIGFATPIANVSYQFQAAAAGTYNICTTAGNCAGTGGGVTTAGGTAGRIAKFTGAQTLGDSIISESGSTVTVGGTLAVNTVAPTAAFLLGVTSQNVTVQGASVAISSTSGSFTNTLNFATPAGSSKTVTLPNASGTIVVSASGPLAIDANGNVSCATCTTSGGGTGGAVDSLNAINGAVLLQGTSNQIVITNDSGTRTITVSTPQDINTSSSPTFSSATLSNTLTVTNAVTAGSLVTGGTLTVTGAATAASFNGLNLTANATGFTVAGGTAVRTVTVTSNVTLDQDLSIASAPTFGGITVNGSATFGNTLTVNGSQFTNNASTLNTAATIPNLITGGPIGTAATTVDVDTSFAISQTTAGQTLSLPAPTATTAGRIVYVINSGTASFLMHGITVAAGAGQQYIWTGAAWTPTSTDTDTAGAGATSVVNDTNITGSITSNVLTLGFTGTLAVTRGGTGASDASTARVNLGAASRGANSDITSISGLTTALSVLQGGTGATTLTANGVLFGNGTGAVGATAAGTTGQCLLANTAAAPSFGTCTGDGGVTTVGAFNGGTANGDGATITGTTIFLQSASTSFPGLVDTAAQTFAGVKTFNANVSLAAGATVAAGQSITLVGGITSTRPAAPTEGMLYYDTTTKGLLVYANSKWQADRSAATVIVADGSTSQNADRADFVVPVAGTSAQTTINAAIASLPASGGTVYLQQGTYTVDGGILLPNNVTLMGAGPSTVIFAKSALANGIYNLVSTSGTENITLTKLKIDGNAAGQTTGNFRGILSNAGSGSGSSGKTGIRISEVIVVNHRNNGVEFSSGANSSITNSSVINNGSTGFGNIVVTGPASYITVSNNFVTGSSSQGIYIDGASNNTITGNTTNSAGRGIFLNNANYNTVTANKVSNNVAAAILVRTSSNNTVTGNTVSNNSSQGIELLFGANNNTVSANNLYDNSSGSGSSIATDATSGSNLITGNLITDTAGTGFAINIASGSTSNYLASNTYSGTGAASINDAGNGTIFANQVDGSGNLINRNQGGLTVGTTVASRSLTLQGSFSASVLPTPAAPTLSTAGTAGTTSYSYAITALDGSGESLASAATTIATGNAILSATNYNNVTWSQVGGAVQYRVYRTATGGTPATTGVIATVAANTFTLSDTGLAGNGAATPTGNTTGNATIAGLVQGGSLNVIGNSTLGGTLTVSAGTGIVGTFSGRVVGANAVNNNEFATLGQVNGAVSGAAGNYIQNGTTLQTANFNIQSALAGNVGAIIRGAVGQTADLLQFQNSAGASVASIDASGSLAAINGLFNGTLTVSSTSNFDAGTLFVDSSLDNVGIGTTITPAKLTVVSQSPTNNALKVTTRSYNSTTSYINTYGQAGDDRLFDVMKTADGGNLYTGFSNSVGAGGFDMTVIKIANNGDLVFSKAFGGAGTEVGNSIVETTDGGIVFVGDTTSVGAGGADIAVVKLNARGELVWSKSVGSTGTDKPFGVTAGPSGSVYFASYTTGLGSAGGQDVLLSYLDASGNLIWSKRAGAINQDTATYIRSTPDGGVLVSGYTTSFGAGGFDMLLMKFNSSGVLQFTRTVGGAANDLGYKVAINAAGEIFLTGETLSFGAGSNDVMLTKLNSAGTLQWSRAFGGAVDEKGYGVEVTSDGGAIVVGYTAGFGAGGQDLLYARFDGAGNMVWAKTFGGAASDQGYALTENADASFTLVGYSASFGAGGNDNLSIRINQDGVVANCTTACANAAVTVASIAPTVTSPALTEADVAATTMNVVFTETNFPQTVTQVANSQLTYTTDTTDFDAFTVDANSNAIFQGGRIGIGTTAPAYLFDVQGGGGIVGRFSGRVVGGSAVNSDEFVTLGQANAAYAATSGDSSYIQNGTTLQVANFNIQSAAAGSVGAVINGAVGQTASLLQIRDSANNVLTKIQANGSIGIVNSIDNVSGGVRISNDINDCVNFARAACLIGSTTASQLLLGGGSGGSNQLILSQGGGNTASTLTSSTSLNIASGSQNSLSGTGVVISSNALGATSGIGASGVNSSFSAQTGQATSGTTGQAGGSGGVLNLLAGVGGSAPAGSTNGNGGNLVLQGGAPGAGAGVAGTYGNILLQQSGGNVGVGIATPGAQLDVVNAGSINTRFLGGGSGGSGFSISGGSAGRVNFAYSGSLNLPASTPFFQFNSGGAQMSQGAVLSVQGTGSDVSNRILELRNAGGSVVSGLTSDGRLVLGAASLGSTAALAVSSSANATAASINAGTITGVGSVLNLQGVLTRSSTNSTYGSGLNISNSISPTSGETNLSFLDINGTVNQTGSATGITNGILIDPVLTSALNFRAINIQSAGGYGIYQSSSASSNYFAGRVGLGVAAPSTGLSLGSTVVQSFDNGSGTPDIYLSRSAAGTLKLAARNDGANGSDISTFEVGGNQSAANNPDGRIRLNTSNGASAGSGSLVFESRRADNPRIYSAGNGNILIDGYNPGATGISINSQSGRFTGIGTQFASSFLTIQGTQPAALAANGTNASSLLNTAGAKGGNTTGTTGQIAGNGGGITLTTGAGGDAPAGSANGNGGNLVLQGGAPGAGLGSAGSYGNIILQQNGGFIGVGTASPQEQFHVTDTIRADNEFKAGENGSAGDAQYTFINDGGTGLFSPSLSVLGLATAGQTRLYVNNSGDIGVGTLNTNTGDLVVNSASAGGLGGTLSITNDAAATVGNRARLGFDLGFFDDRNNLANIDAVLSNINGATDLRVSLWNGSGDNEVLTLLNNGNVGIGDTNPQSRLAVASTSTATTGTLQSSNVFLGVNTAANSTGEYRASNSFAGANPAVGTTINGSVTGVKGQSESYGPGTVTNLIGVLGQVGASSSGSVNAASAFRAYSPYAVGTGTITNAYGLLIDTQKQTGITNGYGIYQGGTADLNYFAGNVGIGLQAPANKLHIADGGITIQNSADVRSIVLNQTSATTKRSAITFNQSSVEQFLLGTDLSVNNTRNFFVFDSVAAAARLTINDAGNVGLGGVSNANARLQVATAASNDGIRLDGTSKYVALTTNLASGSFNGLTQAGDQGLIFGGGAIDTASGFVIAPWKSNTSGIRLNDAGLVGIGAATTANTLTVGSLGDALGSGALRLAASDSVSNGGYTILSQNSVAGGNYGFLQSGDMNAFRNFSINPNGGKVGVGIAVPDATLDVYARTINQADMLFALRSDYLGTNNIKFKVNADGNVFSDAGVYTTPADLAETYVNNDGAVAGEVVYFLDEKTVAKTTGVAQKGLAGIVSTKPGLLLNGVDGIPVALSGKVPTRVSVANGAIRKGDYLTSAPGGLAQKATAAGPTLGIALQDADQDGVIEVFVNLAYFNPFDANNVQAKTVSTETLHTTGDVMVGGSVSIGANLNVSGVTELTELKVKGSVSIAQNLTVEGLTSVAQITVNGKIISAGNAPKLAAGTAAGTSAIDQPAPAVTVDGTDTAGTVTITSGMTIAESGILAEMTFAEAYADGTNFKVALTPTNASALDIRVFVEKTANGFRIVTRDKVTAASTYSFDYIVIGSKQVAKTP